MKTTTTKKSKGLVNEKIPNEFSAKNAKDIVMEYFQAAFRTDFQSARGYLSDNISYVSPLNSFDRAEPYLKYLQHLNRTGLLVKFDIKKVFADNNDVCILHEWNSQIVCVWCHVGDDRKISSIKVIFDPRPFVQQKK